MRYMNEHEEWLSSITQESGRAIALKAGLSPATLNRQIGKGEFTAETVIAIARAYHQSPITALTQTGYLTTSEASGLTTEELGDLLTDRDLIALLAKRVKAGTPYWDQPVSEALETDELAARRSNRNISHVDFTAYGVADDSPDEGGNPDDYVP